MSDIITGTPPELTYANDLVRQAWLAVWAITSGALVVILGWMGLSLIVAEHLGRQQAGWREMVPRLFLGLVAAASSLWWCALGHRRGRRRVRLHRRISQRHPRRPAQGSPQHLSHLRAGRERRHGPGHGPSLPGIRLLRPLRDRADGAAPGPHRHPPGPCPDCVGAVDSAPHGGMGTAMAPPLHDDGVPAGDPAHRAGAGLRLPQPVRRHRRLRAGAGPDLEALDVHVPSSTWRPGCPR